MAFFEDQINVFNKFFNDNPQISIILPEGWFGERPWDSFL